MIIRSVNRDALAISMGMERVLNEIQFWESKPKKVKSVKKRLERLYQARTSLTENPKESKSLVEQLGMFDNDEGFDAAKMADLAKAIEAIQETDAFKTTEGQENLAKMYEALKQMNVDMSSFWTSAKTDRANTEQNANEQQAILGELRKLVKALNEN